MTLRSSWLMGLMFALSACGGGADRGEGQGDPPVVVGGTVTQTEFVSEIEAVGTAFANEQTVITSPVTERIERIAFADGATVRRGAIIARLSSGEETADLSSVVAKARGRQATGSPDRTSAKRLCHQLLG